MSDINYIEDMRARAARYYEVKTLCMQARAQRNRATNLTGFYRLFGQIKGVIL